MLPYLPLICASGTAIYLGYIDYRTGKMPNAITGLSLAGALLFHTVYTGNGGISAALLGMLACGGAPLALYYLSKGQGIGGGDVKALAALGAWLGPDLGIEAELFSLLLLTCGAFVLAIRSGRGAALLRRSIHVMFPWLRQKRAASLTSAPEERTYLRFGPYLALGVGLTCLNRFLIESSSLLLSML